MFTKEDRLAIIAMNKKLAYYSTSWWKFRKRRSLRQEFISAVELVWKESESKKPSSSDE